MGGFDRSTLQTTESYDIFQETWQEGPKLIQERHSAPIVSITDGLFVIGIKLTFFNNRVKLSIKVDAIVMFSSQSNC